MKRVIKKRWKAKLLTVCLSVTMAAGIAIPAEAGPAAEIEAAEAAKSAGMSGTAVSGEGVQALSGKEIILENPSWDYYRAEGISETPAAKPLELVKLTETPNEIIDTDKWFERNGLTLEQETAEDFICEILTERWDGKTGIRVVNKKDMSSVFDLRNYRYADDFAESDAFIVDQSVRWAQVKNGILYFSIGHLTYAETSPHNAYVAAVDLSTGKLLWKSRTLVSNGRNFLIKGDVILCGYGFTAEPDYLYQLDLATGQVIARQSLRSKADYLIEKDGTLYVRTYNTDYTFRIR